MTLRRLCLLCGACVALWCALGVGARATTNARTTADEPQYLMSAQSLAVDRDLDLSNQRTAGAYRDYHEVGLPLQEEIQGDGSRVSPHDPLLPGLLALPMALGGWPLAKLTLALVSGCVASLMVFVGERRLGVRRQIVVPVVLAVSLAAPLAVYATQIYPEIVAVLAVTAAIAIVTAPMQRRRSSLQSVAFAAVVCALPWLSVKYVPVAAAVAVVGWLRMRRPPLVVTLMSGAAGFVVAHLRWYGGLTPYAVGSHFRGGQLEVMGDPLPLGRSVRLVGLLLDRDFGLVAWQPLMFLTIPAVAALAASRSPHRLVLLLPAAAGWLNATFLALTMHGWWFPGRQVIVVLPCLVLAIAWWVDRIDVSPRGLWAAAALGASVHLWLVVQVLTTRTRLVTTFADLTHPWWRGVRSLLPDGRADRLLDTVLVVVWTALVVIATIVAVRGQRRAGSRRVPVTRSPDPHRELRIPDDARQRVVEVDPDPEPVPDRLHGVFR